MNMHACFELLECKGKGVRTCILVCIRQRSYFAVMQPRLIMQAEFTALSVAGLHIDFSRLSRDQGEMRDAVFVIRAVP